MRINNTWVYTHINSAIASCMCETNLEVMPTIESYSKEAVLAKFAENNITNITDDIFKGNPIVHFRPIGVDVGIPAKVSVRMYFDETSSVTEVFESTKQTLIFLLIAYFHVANECHDDCNGEADKYPELLTSAIMDYFSKIISPDSDEYIDESTDIYINTRMLLEKRTYGHYMSHIEERDAAFVDEAEKADSEFMQ